MYSERNGNGKKGKGTLLNLTGKVKTVRMNFLRVLRGLLAV
jgi:hypothetical protein